MILSKLSQKIYRAGKNPDHASMTVVWLAYFAFLEALSSQTSRIPPCIVKAGQQYAEGANGNECPTLHVFLIEASAVVFEKLGDPHYLVAIATVALFIVTGMLWWATRALVKSAERTAERQLRAYIAVDEAFVVRFGNTKFEIHILLKNYGQTPAYKFGTAINLAVVDKGFDPAKASYEMHARSIIGPSAHAHQRLDFELGDSVIKGILEGKIVIRVSGRAIYYDAFEIDRWVTYSLTATGPTSTIKFDGTSCIGWGLVPDEDGYKAN